MRAVGGMHGTVGVGTQWGVGVGTQTIYGVGVGTQGGIGSCHALCSRKMLKDTCSKMLRLANIEKTR